VGAASSRPQAPRNPENPREWCVTSIARLDDDQPEAALDAAAEALARDPRLDWAHRLSSLALERLGREPEAVAAAERAVRLAPGSWAARLRLGSALSQLPGRWRDAAAQAARAVWFAPEEPDVHVLAGDLSLVRGEHERAARSYRAALRADPGHPGARINLGLTLLRWDRPRGHHDPAWSADPRDTARARRALEIWSRQVRILLAVALCAVAAVAFWPHAGPAPHANAQIAGLAVLALTLVPTVRQARKVRMWSHVAGMLRRDLWLSVSLTLTPLVAAAYLAAVLTLPVLASWDAAKDPLWAGLSGLVVFNGVAVVALRVLTESWRGRPVRALAEFTAALPERTARRDVDITVWIVAVRAWSLVLLAAAVSLIPAGPWAAAGGLAVPVWLFHVRRRAGLGGHLRAVLAADRPLATVLPLLVVASAALAVAGAQASAEATLWGWRIGLAAPAAAMLVFGLRAARAWWRGAPGPWRASLVMCEGGGRRLPGDVRPTAGLGDEVRRAFIASRGVVLAYADGGGPRALAVGAVTSIGPAGELRLIAAEEAWQAVERDPKVAVFAADPIDRRFWAEVRGIALGDPEAGVLRVTPKHVVVGEYPGRHQGRGR
jgi:hypothetical protein